jgi:hypothetical protein
MTAICSRVILSFGLKELSSNPLTKPASAAAPTEPANHSSFTSTNLFVFAFGKLKERTSSEANSARVMSLLGAKLVSLIPFTTSLDANNSTSSFAQWHLDH